MIIIHLLLLRLMMIDEQEKLEAIKTQEEIKKIEWIQENEEGPPIAIPALPSATIMTPPETPQPVSEQKPKPQQKEPAGDSTIHVHSKYDVRKISTVTAEELDEILGGVLKGHGKHYVQYGKKYGIDPAFLAAISIHETGNGTSDAVRFKNNVGGIMKSDGMTLRKFHSIEESIGALADLLHRLYLPNDKTTPEKIQQWYAPVGVANDPTNLNQHWVNGVVSYWKEIRIKANDASNS